MVYNQLERVLVLLGKVDEQFSPSSVLSAFDALEEDAQALGLTAEALADEENEWLATFTASFSDDGCLSPEDVESYLRGRPLSEAGHTHVESCPSCRSLLAAARPERERCQQVGITLSQAIVSSTTCELNAS